MDIALHHGLEVIIVKKYKDSENIDISSYVLPIVYGRTRSDKKGTLELNIELKQPLEFEKAIQSINLNLDILENVWIKIGESDTLVLN